MTRLNKISKAFLISSILAGCAAYSPKPLLPLEKASSFQGRALHNPDLKDFMETNLRRKVRPWPPESWDLTFLSLAAIYYHPELEVSRARQKSAQASVTTAGARPNPSFSFAPEFSTNPSTGVSPWILGATLNIPIETAGKRGYRLNRARYLAQAADLNTAAVLWQIRSKLRKALLDLLAARQESVIREKQTKVAEELVLLFRQRLAAGEISENEVNAAQIISAQTKLQLQSAQTLGKEAMATLASSIGLPVSALKTVVISTEAAEQVPSIASLSFPDLRQRALLGRPDVLAALAEYDAAESSLQLEIAKQYPDINLGPGYSWDQGQNKWIFGFTVALPILNRNEGPIAEAEARRAETEARFVALQARTAGEIDKATANLGAASQKLGAANALMAMQKRRFLSLRALYDAGEADRSAFLNSRLECQSGALSRLSTLVELQDAFGLLEDALYHRISAGAQPATIPAAITETPRTGR